MGMTSRPLLFVLLLVIGLGASACRQPEGPMPIAQGEVPNRIHDIGRDLQSVAGGETQARQDLTEDVVVFVESYADARPALEELSKKTADVVVGKTLNEQAAQQLAHQIWTSAAARELSQKQVETLQNDTQALLVSIGVTEEHAQGVAAQIGEVQKLVTNRPRRWYEFF
jgi:hypothetical protein